MLKNKLKSNAKKIDSFLRNYLKGQKKSLLIKPMNYGVLSGGKKIRSSIIFAAGKLYNVKSNKLLNICGAVECIHSYSLIHDDLPCMDDDKLRRGKATAHIKYGESTAVLAGNSLLTLAFEMISDERFKIKNENKVLLIKKLAECSGHAGIAGGQELDLKYEKKRKKFQEIINMQRKKTGKLFSFCCFAPGQIAGKDKNTNNKLIKLGEDIGLLFQLADDFLDVKGKSKYTGKTVNKDKKKGKSTIINLIGYDNAFDYAINLKKKILRNLKKHGNKAKDLKDIINFILERKN
tara:strand:- start:2906 stop:3781 length:876 start_codon:yes stop_codon:yes gene_type:complete